MTVEVSLCTAMEQLSRHISIIKKFQHKSPKELNHTIILLQEPVDQFRGLSLCTLDILQKQHITYKFLAP